MDLAGEEAGGHAQSRSCGRWCLCHALPRTPARPNLADRDVRGADDVGPWMEPGDITVGLRDVRFRHMVWVRQSSIITSFAQSPTPGDSPPLASDRAEYGESGLCLWTYPDPVEGRWLP